MKTTIKLFILCFFIAGCKSFSPNIYEVHYTNTSIRIDGKLNDASWIKAKSLSFRGLPPSCACIENGVGKILWDDKYIYFGAVFYDSDIVQEANENWQHHYRTGDVMEVFLKPPNKRYYWEIYATPNNKKTSFFYLSKGRLGLPSGFNYKMSGLIVAATCMGTLNDANDYDKQWTVEIAIPREELEKNGEKILNGKIWDFLIGRYNYSAYLDDKEITISGLPNSGNLHDFKSWNSLKFIKP